MGKPSGRRSIGSVLARWLPLATAIVLMTGLSYGLVQQSLRQSANDPQVQVAGDYAAMLAAGAPPQSLTPASKVDMAQNLGLYLMIFDDKGKRLLSSAVLDGRTPALPKGVLESARLRAENRVTWQPKPGVRSAIVVVHYVGKQSGFVVVGKSLREVERREAQIQNIAIAGGLVTLLATLGLAYLFVP